MYYKNSSLSVQHNPTLVAVNAGVIVLAPGNSDRFLTSFAIHPFVCVFTPW
jgi:hypothetical protein